MAQQTAVEWLENVYNTQGRILSEQFDQAKQMFEEQIENAFDMGDHCIDLPDGGWEQKYKSAQHYYNETYKKVKPWVNKDHPKKQVSIL